MRSFNDELEVSRNESFVYHRELMNKDGSPYIVPLSMTNPHIRITIADETFIAKTRYILNIYLDLNSDMGDSALPKFYMSNPVKLVGKFSTNIPGDEDNLLPTGLPDDVTIYNYAVYYSYDDVTKENVYMRYMHDDVDHWEIYKYEIIVPFGIDITRHWTAKNYVYGIFLMDGVLYIDQMVDTVTEYLCTELSILPEAAHEIASTMTEEELYEFIKQRSGGDVAMIDGREVIIDDEDARWSPYWIVDADYPMLNPAKITVKNDPIGGII